VSSTFQGFLLNILNSSTLLSAAKCQKFRSDPVLLFPGSDGKLMPMFQVHMDLEAEFAADLRRMGQMAHDLRLRLEALRNSK
jgi:hypothetical protein